jgi:ABC-type sulfate/molybdate transport systems ATPase subunit
MAGEFVVFVGPSGCGKSTLLRMIAGLETISGGEVRIGDQIVNDCRRIDHMLDRRPGQLSGGPRQRVAIGRAIVRQPKVFLFDEPLSNLDAQLRGEMRSEIKRLHQRLGATIIYVTHDQVEAMTMADRIAVLSAGRKMQYDTPDTIYNQRDRPAHPVREAIGHEGRRRRRDDRACQEPQGHRPGGARVPLHAAGGRDDPHRTKAASANCTRWRFASIVSPSIPRPATGTASTPTPAARWSRSAATAST